MSKKVSVQKKPKIKIVQSKKLKPLQTSTQKRNINSSKKAERELRESETRFKSLFEYNPIMIFAIDKKGKVLSLNKTAVTQLGYSAKELIGKSVLNVFYEEDKPAVVQSVNSLLKGKNKQKHWQFRKVTKNGKLIWVSEIARVMKWTNNQEIILVTCEDITKQKEADEALRESEERFKELSTMLPQTVFETDRNGILIYINHIGLQTFGLTQEDLSKGISSLQLIAPSDRKDALADMFKIIRGEKIHRREYSLVNKNGTIFPALLFSNSIVRNNQVIGIRGILIDITEQKKASEEIRKLYRGVHQSPAMVVITDKLGNIEYVNNKFCETTGYTLEEVIGKNPRIIKSGEKTKREYEILWKTILSGNEWHGEFHNRKKNGELFWELASISPIKNDKEEVTHFIAIKEDITERKKILEELIYAKDKAERSDRLKSEFLAQMSHEIRTPINIILNFVNLMKEELVTEVNEDLKTSYEIINSASRRIIRTIDLILNMSEVQTGTYEPSKNFIDINKNVLDKLFNEYKNYAAQKNLDFSLRNETGDTKILLDEYSATQIFANLIDNAIKYTNAGKVEILVARNNNNKLTVEVNDTGIGISKEFLPLLFESFVQEEQGYTRKFDGNGLGLALVKNYCDINNAQIEVESAKGVGSLFRVIFN